MKAMKDTAPAQKQSNQKTNVTRKFSHVMSINNICTKEWKRAPFKGKIWKSFDVCAFLGWKLNRL